VDGNSNTIYNGSTTANSVNPTTSLISNFPISTTTMTIYITYTNP
jgi:hypothetical protein